MISSSNSQKNIALVTCERFPLLSDDDQPLIASLRGLGLNPTPVIWDDPTVDWHKFGLILLRSTWDYYLKVPKFLAWLKTIENASELNGTEILNRPSVVRWNLDKTYLKTLMELGIPVIPTVWLKSTETASLSHLIKPLGWKQMVLKPTISADAFQTIRLNQDDTELFETELHKLQRRDLKVGLNDHYVAMLQPFLPEIIAEGEWSFLFFDGKYSHAVLKKPSTGDFRVQTSHGGKATPMEAPAALLAQAEHAFRVAKDCVGVNLLYARVDMIRRDKQLLLVELELIEPTLYLQSDASRIDRFTASIEKFLFEKNEP